MTTLPQNSTAVRLPPIGAKAIDLIRAFPGLMPEVAGFEFFTYFTQPSMLEEIESLVKPELRDAIRSIRSLLEPDELGRSRLKELELTAAVEATLRKIIQFDRDWRIGWLNIHLEPYSDEDLKRVLSLVLRHNSGGEPFPVSASRLSSGRLPCGQMSEGEVLALTSRCELHDGSAAQIPLLDFRCEPNDYSLRLLKMGLEKIVRGGGMIALSGRSYHFYGFRPLSEAEWGRFMAQSILLAPLTDIRYVAHRMLDGFAALRLTTSPQKPSDPIVAAYLEC